MRYCDLFKNLIFSTYLDDHEQHAYHLTGQFLKKKNIDEFSTADKFLTIESMPNFFKSYFTISRYNTMSFDDFLFSEVNNITNNTVYLIPILTEIFNIYDPDNLFFIFNDLIRSTRTGIADFLKDAEKVFYNDYTYLDTICEFIENADHHFTFQSSYSYSLLSEMVFYLNKPKRTKNDYKKFFMSDFIDIHLHAKYHLNVKEIKDSII